MSLGPRGILVSMLCVLALPSMCARPTHTIVGTWFGHFDVVNTDGKISHDTAVMVIDKDQFPISGSIGPTIDQQMPWSGGSLVRNQLRFHLEGGGGMEFEIAFRKGVLIGTARGDRMNAHIDVSPAPGLLPHSKLQEEILIADKQLFGAFQSCDLNQYASFLSKDIEFYQDHTGKTGYEANLKSLTDRCAEGIKLRRELEPDLTIVNAAPGFGAIESGVHRFYSTGRDGKEHLDATARFTNVWSKSSGTWKLVRAISFDHH